MTLNAPELHSKKVIGAFSIIFSLVFGSVLLAYNMKRANNRKGQIQVLIFGVLYTITTITLLNVINAPNNSAIVVNALGATILNEYFWNKHLGKELKHRKRSWTKPAIISILIITPFLLAVIYSY